MTRRKPDESDKLLGAKVKELRHIIGWPQKWLASKLNVSIQQIQKYEKGANRISANNLELIAKAFNKPLSYFYEEDLSKKIDNNISSSLKDIRMYNDLMKIENPDHKKAINVLIKGFLSLK